MSEGSRSFGKVRWQDTPLRETRPCGLSMCVHVLKISPTWVCLHLQLVPSLARDLTVCLLFDNASPRYGLLSWHSVVALPMQLWIPQRRRKSIQPRGTVLNSTTACSVWLFVVLPRVTGYCNKKMKGKNLLGHCTTSHFYILIIEIPNGLYLLINFKCPIKGTWVIFEPLCPIVKRRKDPINLFGGE